jgi:hypothetical protein
MGPPQFKWQTLPLDRDWGGDRRSISKLLIDGYASQSALIPLQVRIGVGCGTNG